MKLPDFKEHSLLNSLRKKIGAELNFMYRPKNEPIWDLKVNDLLEKGELRNIDLSEIQINNQNLLEYKKNKILVYREHQLERVSEGTHQFHFYNCATIKRFREDKKYNGKYVANKGANFKVNIESFGKGLAKNILVDLRVCKNCLKESNYYNYEDVDYNMKNHIYKNFSKKDYFEAVI